jgi:hypothetical protein
MRVSGSVARHRNAPPDCTIVIIILEAVLTLENTRHPFPENTPRKEIQDVNPNPDDSRDRPHYSADNLNVAYKPRGIIRLVKTVTKLLEVREPPQVHPIHPGRMAVSVDSLKARFHFTDILQQSQK